MVCNQIAQLGALGVSVVSRSGDDGVGSACQTNDGKKTLRFTPIFPASCPFVTSVGGTVGNSPERGIGFSSGGFSDKWARPAYQEAAVNGFLQQNGNKWAQYFNASGRGFPDVAAQANGFKVINNGRTQLTGGTSAAAPVIASIVALLNAQRLQSGQPALGFLNPWLYSNAGKMLTDITAGKSTGCSGRSKHSYQSAGKIDGASWPAVKGWDPVTGLGTPKFKEMLANLPAI
jgi:tripeptidyl-peptidase-1